MDKRSYFLIGDVFSNTLVALLAALAVHGLISPGWPMLPAMVVGMVLAMVLGSLCCLLCLMRFFGAMEIMLPAMLSSMLTGMVVAMSRVMTTMDRIDHLLLAMVIALLTTVTVWIVSQRLSGEQLLPGKAPHD
jgi:hypothetical protein